MMEYAEFANCVEALIGKGRSIGGRGRRGAKSDFALARKDQNAGFGV
jgi:hypothetical protein